MCGRFSLHHSPQQVAMRFLAAPESYDDSSGAGRFNIAPTESVAVVTQQNGARHLDRFRWGLIPFWAKEAAIGGKLINARAETVAEKPAFRGPLQRRRCIVPADGFYEWRKDGAKRVPFYFRRRDAGLFGFAGLWDEWRSPEGDTVRSYTLVTCPANAVLAPVHDRMPVMLHERHEADWLNPRNLDTADLLGMLQPYPAEEMEGYEVSPRVNRAGFDDPSLILAL